MRRLSYRVRHIRPAVGERSGVWPHDEIGARWGCAVRRVNRVRATSARSRMMRVSNPKWGTMHDESVTLSATSSSISRRTVIKAGAWSVPVVALAVAAPMAAASGNEPQFRPGTQAAGNSGNLQRTAGTAEIEGYVQANINLVPQAGEVLLPSIVASYTTSGAWSSVSLLDENGNAFVDGGTITDFNGIVWAVSAPNSGTVTFTSVATTIPGSTGSVYAPYVVVRGLGDGSSTDAAVQVNLHVPGTSVSTTGEQKTNVGDVLPG